MFPAGSLYEILGIAGNDKAVSKRDIKAAYHQALLLHHPDKLPAKHSSPGAPCADSKSFSYSIDEITAAYKVLSDPRARAQYDSSLRLLGQAKHAQGRDHGFHTGLETVDLDDLPFDDEQETWYRSCRCGDDRGFIVTEKDLEKEAEHGELHIACKGCSLWLRVLFAVSSIEESTKILVNDNG